MFALMAVAFLATCLFKAEVNARTSFHVLAVVYAPLLRDGTASRAKVCRFRGELTRSQPYLYFKGKFQILSFFGEA
jgi:hypothetical protein